VGTGSAEMRGFFLQEALGLQYPNLNYICSGLEFTYCSNAQMAKLVDALPSGGSVRKDVQVRILFWALDWIGSHFWSQLFF
jgi:hypothetical protein